ncbi:MAG TPA: hypothetical protein VNQ77_08115 [Frankiaceae bacterium]|nr:hypothetical protein [Frankiaceae bacterium]
MPLAQPRTRPLSAAEPAKIVGWLILAGWGGFSLWAFLRRPHVLSFTVTVLCLGVLAGFVQAHRYEGTTFSRVWFGFFTAAIAVLGVLAKVLSIVF